jgi:hypothetical protein
MCCNEFYDPFRSHELSTIWKTWNKRKCGKWARLQTTASSQRTPFEKRKRFPTERCFTTGGPRTAEGQQLNSRWFAKSISPYIIDLFTMSRTINDWGLPASGEAVLMLLLSTRHDVRQLRFPSFHCKYTGNFWQVKWSVCIRAWLLIASVQCGWSCRLFDFTTPQRRSFYTRAVWKVRGLNLLLRVGT